MARGDCLDYELMPVRRLVVLAASPDDGSSDYAAVFIHIDGNDDHPPRFTADHQEALVPEGAARGTVVARLPAVYDPDHPGNDRFIPLELASRRLVVDLSATGPRPDKLTDSFSSHYVLQSCSEVFACSVC